jgi:hypothetical protein
MSSFDDFKKANFYHRLNRIIQIVLALSLILGLNYLATKYYKRADLTNNRSQSLSAESLAYLKNLDENVQVVVTISQESQRNSEQLLYRYVSDLLKEYHHNSKYAQGYRLTVEYVDTYKNLKRAEELSRKYGLDKPDQILFVCGDRQSIVSSSDIIQTEKNKEKTFTGEQAFTSALLEVTTEKQPTVYFTIGHGEMSIDSVDPARGLTEIVRELKSRNLNIKKLDLLQWNTIPDDADLVVTIDPRGAFSPVEQEILRNYLSEKAGRMILMFSPGQTTGLKDLLNDWGLSSPDYLIQEKEDRYLESQGNYLIRQFADHPITETLLRNQTPLMAGMTRPVIESPSPIADDRLERIKVIASSPESWAESNWKNIPAKQYQLTPGVDISGPVTVAMLAERSAASQLGINLPGGRLFVIGTGDLIANRRVSSYGNYTLALNAVNWILNRNRSLSITPRKIKRIQFSLSSNDLKHSGWALLIAPALITIIGFIVHFIRRN